jgi:hypothetical protein
MAGKAFPREHSERVCRGHGVVCDSSGRQRCRLRPKNKLQKQRKQWLSGAHASSDSRACRNAGEQTTSTAAWEVYGKADRVCSAKRCTGQTGLGVWPVFLTVKTGKLGVAQNLGQSCTRATLSRGFLRFQKVNTIGLPPNGVDFLAGVGAGRAKLLLSRIPAASAAPIPAAP